MKQKFNLSQVQISYILSLINQKKFVIPELQRPFVWKRTQVKDLIDSLYNGYPTGYIVVWKNPDVRTKDGKFSEGREILIDGQQRVTAIMAALAGLEVMDEDFNKDRIKIAFNPVATDRNKRFEVQNATHLKDTKWIPDISEMFKPGFDSFSFVNEYCKVNEGMSPTEINGEIQNLMQIMNMHVGVIKLDDSLDIDEVTDVFIRINSKGTKLDQSDFVMSKMASDEEHGGNDLRKVIDYFCHLSVKPEFYNHMKKDTEFSKTDFAPKITWLKDSKNNIYKPEYKDMIRVALMYSFDRGRMADLVSLLSGRDFETKNFKEEIVVESYSKLKSGIEKIINEYNFEQFILAIKGAGFKSEKLLNSQMTLDFAYMLYLKLSDDPEIEKSQVKRLVQKWFVMSTLTGRYVGSPESRISRDIRSINEKGFLRYAKEIEDSVLSEAFWNVTLPQNLETSSRNSPAFNTFLAAQINLNCSSLLMRGTEVSDLLNISGDVHHIFPRAYLKKNGIDVQRIYNQVANYVYLDTQVNKAVGEDSPKEYFERTLSQFETGNMEIGNIKNIEELENNLFENALPKGIINMTAVDYETFLIERRKLMSQMIERYYKGL